jgi:chlorobactene glucosyltransferase
MKLLLVILLTVSVVELSMWLPIMWRWRKALATMLLPVLVGASSLIFIFHPRLWTALIATFGLYRAFNLSRLLKARMHEKYLHHVTFRASWILISYQAITLLLLQLVTNLDITGKSRWIVLGSLQVLMASVLLMSTIRHIRTTREPEVTESYADRDLPTLTVAIPARNETDDLKACIESLVANDYPKLEIVVIDDCSSNAKTPEIIRSYAHDGVRFIGGSEPEGTWLAKNWAYERLSEESNGDYLLFCGVDTRFTPLALRRLVETLLAKKKSMLSVMPENHMANWKSAFIQPIRYAWELSLPRRIFQRPPVLSTCWIIKKDLLESAGGFRAVSRSIVPESHFARTASVHDGYSFIRSNEVMSYKKYEEQWATAVRTRYPQLHRRPELVALVAFMELAGLIGPYALLVASIVNGWLVAGLLAFGAIVLLSLTYSCVVAITYSQFRPSSTALLPFVALLDIVLLHDSMAKYEFSDVIWKGRNVCIPVMHVIPHLPSV